MLKSKVKQGETCSDKINKKPKQEFDWCLRWKAKKTKICYLIGTFFQNAKRILFLRTGSVEDFLSGSFEPLSFNITLFVSCS